MPRKKSDTRGIDVLGLSEWDSKMIFSNILSSATDGTCSATGEAIHVEANPKTASRCDQGMIKKDHPYWRAMMESFQDHATVPRREVIL